MLDPNNKNRMDSTGRPAVVDDRGNGIGKTGILVAIALAAIVGLGIWSFSKNTTTASNTRSQTTTGMNTTSPSAPALPTTTGTSNTATPAAPASR